MHHAYADLCDQARDLTRDIPGFMPHDEGCALLHAAMHMPPGGVALEIGSYCGRSTVYLGLGAQAVGGTVVTVDHHRGSEEHQVGWEYHDPELADRSGVIDTAPRLRQTLRDCHLEDVVVTMIADSGAAARVWQSAVDLVFLDGSHTFENAHADFERWAKWVKPGGALLIHDVFEDPADGGQAPHAVMKRALAEGGFDHVSRTGSLRELGRFAPQLI